MNNSNANLVRGQYTPVYFIENSSTNQARSYMITPNNQNPDKPVSENLKSFYENSGKLENNLTLESNIKNCTKKSDINIIGNNLKLASFLLPKAQIKNESLQQTTQVNNVTNKTGYIANTSNNACNSNPLPKLDISSKVVKLKDLPKINRCKGAKLEPKIKPKTLNGLCSNQMDVVDNALKMFKESQTLCPETTYDPVTNTKFMYKVVASKDLVVGKNKQNQHKFKILENKAKAENPSNNMGEGQKAIEINAKKRVKAIKLLNNKYSRITVKRNSPIEIKPISSETSNPPTLPCNKHVPVNKNVDLFQCLKNIIKDGSVNCFLEQLGLFAEKLKSSVPCLLGDGSGTPTVINEDVGRLLGLNPGCYNINVNALNCEKDKSGHCSHNSPPPTQVEAKPNHIDTNKTEAPDLSQYIKYQNITINNEQIVQQDQIHNCKKRKMSDDEKRQCAVIDELFADLSNTHKTDFSIGKTLDNKQQNEGNETGSNQTNTEASHTQFRSAHFDIRSSPIKSTSTGFTKFLINPAKIAKLQVETIRPIDKVAQAIEMNYRAQGSKQTSVEFNAELDTNIQRIEPQDWPQLQTENFVNTESVEPSLLHGDSGNNNSCNANNTCQWQSVISFLDELDDDLDEDCDLQQDFFSIYT